MGSAEEGVVLQSPRQGLPESRRRLCDILQAIRLQCGLRELDGGLVRGKEGLVLQSRRQGLPTSSWWVCLEVALKCPGNDSAAKPTHMFCLIAAALAFVPSSGAQRQLSEGSDRTGEQVKALAFVPSSGARLPLSDRCDHLGLHR